METGSVETTQPSQGIPLYKGNNVEVFIPIEPKIPIEEGLQIQIEGKDPAEKNGPKDILLRNLYAILAAKVIAEGSQTPQEVWANTRIEGNNVVNAYGRNVLNPNSRRKPVNTADRNPPEIDSLPQPYVEKKLQRLFRSYMHRWIAGG